MISRKMMRKLVRKGEEVVREVVESTRDLDRGLEGDSVQELVLGLKTENIGVEVAQNRIGDERGLIRGVGRKNLRKKVVEGTGRVVGAVRRNIGVDHALDDVRGRRIAMSIRGREVAVVDAIRRVEKARVISERDRKARLVARATRCILLNRWVRGLVLRRVVSRLRKKCAPEKAIVRVLVRVRAQIRARSLSRNA